MMTIQMAAHASRMVAEVEAAGGMAAFIESNPLRWALACAEQQLLDTAGSMSNYYRGAPTAALPYAAEQLAADLAATLKWLNERIAEVKDAR